MGSYSTFRTSWYFCILNEGNNCERLLRCTLVIQFRFNYRPYKQSGCLAICSTIGAPHGNIFVSHLELDDLDENMSQLHWYGYNNDDNFIVIDENPSLSELLGAFDKAHRSIQSNYKSEYDGCSKFLTIQLENDRTTLSHVESAENQREHDDILTF